MLEFFLYKLLADRRHLGLGSDIWSLLTLHPDQLSFIRLNGILPVIKRVVVHFVLR